MTLRKESLDGSMLCSGALWDVSGDYIIIKGGLRVYMGVYWLIIGVWIDLQRCCLCRAEGSCFAPGRWALACWSGSWFSSYHQRQRKGTSCTLRWSLIRLLIIKKNCNYSRNYPLNTSWRPGSALATLTGKNGGKLQLLNPWLQCTYSRGYDSNFPRVTKFVYSSRHWNEFFHVLGLDSNSEARGEFYSLSCLSVVR